MSGARNTARLARWGPPRMCAARRYMHQPAISTGGLLRNQVLPVSQHNKRRPWPFGAYSLHNVPAARTISFARVLPKLALKLVRIPAMFGAATIGGLAYLQYQATRELIKDYSVEKILKAHLIQRPATTQSIYSNEPVLR